jgi:hypothetical protein
LAAIAVKSLTESGFRNLFKDTSVFFSHLRDAPVRSLRMLEKGIFSLLEKDRVDVLWQRCIQGKRESQALKSL